MPVNAQGKKSLTYIRYLRLDELLELQQPLSREHDEMLFIIIHQVYELWFKQLLHEVAYLRDRLWVGHTPGSLATLQRVRTILKTLVAQVDVLETMTPVAFNAFRTRLEAASGFQSAQFRELEFVLGAKRRDILQAYPPGSAQRLRLERALAQPTLWDAFLRYLDAHERPVPVELLERDVSAPPQPSPALQETLAALYHEQAAAAHVCERLLDLDEGLQEWRYRHVKMVERTIGSKSGTGGSSGADYLRETLFKPLFPDLWAIRDRF
ncbi:tryptophan 2,3-dioxygenase family protein [Aquisalimonas sp.]|uniref:tryptophan 2,3-dioxygenase n=1 Tax=Aquisalimonas sp. TaxID=1872621 RepID=UPI0025C3CDDA|nr:tryptophan 2,3-dioxygenase family protein [Aquisalimonas sp.]